MSTAGNTAKIREALEKVCTIASEIILIEDNADTVVTALVIVEICESALLIPPRNCDLVATKQEAWLEWQNACAEAWPAEGPLFNNWLFAPAKKAEGGAA